VVITSDAFFAIQIAQLPSLAARYGLASNGAGANEIRTAAAAGAHELWGQLLDGQSSSRHLCRL